VALEPVALVLMAPFISAISAAAAAAAAVGDAGAFFLHMGGTGAATRRRFFSVIIALEIWIYCLDAPPSGSTA
jgi:hypothetical protein